MPTDDTLEKEKEKKPAKPSQKQAAVATIPAVSPKPQLVKITNQTTQKIVANILTGGGNEMKSIEFNSKQTLQWPRLGDYGPYVSSLVSAGHLTITTV